MAKKTMNKKKYISIGSRKQAELAMSRIAVLHHGLEKKQAQMNLDIEKAKQKYAGATDNFKDEMDGLYNSLFVYAEANKKDLLKGKSKTCKLSSGSLSWRKTPPAVKVTNTEKALIELEESCMSRCICTHESINKEMVLSLRNDVAFSDVIADLKYLKITSVNELVIKVDEVKIEHTKKIKKKVRK